MSIVFGLVAALGWGIGDVLVTQAARRIGVGRLMIFFEGIGLLAISLVLLLRPSLPDPSPGAWALMVGLGLLNCAGAFLLYRAFQIGTLAVVAPLASAYALVTALLAILAGERVPLLLLLGALQVIGGVIIVTRAQYAGAVVSPRGLPETLGVVAVFGVFYWALSFVTPALGIYWPIFVLRAIRVLAGLAIAGAGARLALHEVPFARLAAAAALSTIAFIAFNLGLQSTYTTVVVTLASLASAVTVVLARAMLHERLSRGQWFGVALILLGVLLVSR
jgi:drug/metabolite transporter (DMT)-like permease